MSEYKFYIGRIGKMLLEIQMFLRRFLDMKCAKINYALMKRILACSRLRKSKNSTKWIVSLSQMLSDIDYHRIKEVKDSLDFLEGFAFDNIQLLHKCKRRSARQDPIVICVMRDEKERIEFFFDHYRNLGIKHFVILDNDSVDGTVEYLLEQKDTDIFSVKRAFSEGRKQGWINRLLCLYGFDRWYLYVDAEELLEWPERSQYNLKHLLNILETNGINRVGAIMVDMYPGEEIFKQELSSFDINSFYFDKDSYYTIKEGEKTIYTGGPRKRVFNMECWLSKYPLFKLQSGEMMISAHYLYPYHPHRKYPFLLALLHFKFLTTKDLEKTKRYVKEKNHTNNSIELKRYLQNYNEGVNRLYDRDSVHYEGSESLSCIKDIVKMSELL